jgi:hypothetical protein
LNHTQEKDTIEKCKYKNSYLSLREHDDEVAEELTKAPALFNEQPTEYLPSATKVTLLYII